jgi:hypothetical protein
MPRHRRFWLRLDYDGLGNRLTQQTYGSAPAATYYFYDGANHLCWAGPTNPQSTSCSTTPISVRPVEVAEAFPLL